MGTTAPTFTPETTQDYTSSSTTVGAIGAVGGGGAGILNAIPMVSGWQVQGGGAKCTANFFYTGQCYYSVRGSKYDDQIAIQSTASTGSNIASCGLGFNPITGEGYVVEWFLNGSPPILIISRITTNNTTYPAVLPNVVVQLATLSPGYSGKASLDWLVFQMVRNGPVVSLTAFVCPDNSGAPNLGSPRAGSTLTATDGYAPLATGGYSFLSGGNSGIPPLIGRVVNYSAPQFGISVPVMACNQRKNVVVNGIGTSWNSSTPFAVSDTTGLSGTSLLAQNVTSGTSTTLSLDVGAIDDTIYVTDGANSNSFIQSVYGQVEQRYIYGVERGFGVWRCDPNGNNFTILIPQSAMSVVPTGLYIYGVVPDPTGQFLYVMGPHNMNGDGVSPPNPNPPLIYGAITKWTVGGAYVSTITANVYNNPRKGCFLPNGDMLFVEYGSVAQPGQLWRIHNDTVITAFAPAYTSLNGYGMCVFQDPVLGPCILQAGWGSFNVLQFKIDPVTFLGTYVKIWASGGVFAPTNKPSDVVQGADGYVYVSLWDASTVEKFTNLGVHVSSTSLPAPSAHSHAITYLSDGRLVVPGEEFSQTNQFYPSVQSGNLFPGVSMTSGEPVDAKVGLTPAFPTAPWPAQALNWHPVTKNVLLASVPSGALTWYITDGNGNTIIPKTTTGIVQNSGASFTFTAQVPNGQTGVVWLVSAGVATPIGSIDVSPIKDGAGITQGTVTDPAATTTSFLTNLPMTYNNQYLGSTMWFPGGAQGGVTAYITSSTASTGGVTLNTPLPAAPAQGTFFLTFPGVTGQ